MDKRYCFWYFYGIFFCFSASLSMLPLKNTKTEKEEDILRYVFGVSECVFLKQAFKRKVNETKEKKNWKWSVNKSFLRRFIFSPSLFFFLWFTSPISLPVIHCNERTNILEFQTDTCELYTTTLTTYY